MQNTVWTLRELWRRRFAVVAFALIAAIVGALVAYEPTFPPKSRSDSVGVASVRILVDTPDSQVVAIGAEGAGDLGGHASLLAQLMLQGEAKAAIARRAGVDAKRLVTVAASGPSQIDSSPVSGPPETKALVVRTLTSESGNQLPIIGVDAQAADAESAAKLANAAVAGLEDFVASKASIAGVPDDRKLHVRGLNVAQGENVVRGPSKTMAVALAIFVFGALCALLLLTSVLARNWRAVAEAEQKHRGDGGWSPERADVEPEITVPAPPPASPSAPSGAHGSPAAGEHHPAEATADAFAIPASRSMGSRSMGWSDPPL